MLPSLSQSGVAVIAINENHNMQIALGAERSTRGVVPQEVSG